MAQTTVRGVKSATNRSSLHSRVVSLKYTPSFYEDYLALQEVAVVQPSARRPQQLAGREVSLLARPKFARKYEGPVRREGIQERRAKLSKKAKQHVRELLRRIGLTNCKCIFPRIRQIDRGYNVKKTRIPIFELHCPKVKGSAATYFESTTSSGDFRIELSFLGTGADFGVTFEEKTSDGITVMDGACCKIVREARVVIRKVSYVCEKCKTRTGTKLIFGLAPEGDELIPLTIKRNKEKCNKPIRELKQEEYREISLPKKVEKRKSITIADGTHNQSSLGLSIAGIELRGTVAVQTLRDVHHEYTLQGPRTYYYYPISGLNKFWTTARLRSRRV